MNIDEFKDLIGKDRLEHSISQLREQIKAFPKTSKSDEFYKDVDNKLISNLGKLTNSLNGIINGTIKNRRNQDVRTEVRRAILSVLDELPKEFFSPRPEQNTAISEIVAEPFHNNPPGNQKLILGLLFFTAVASSISIYQVFFPSKHDSQNIDNIGIEMVYVQGGKVRMVSENNLPPAIHDNKVPVSSFEIGLYEVTNKQWYNVMKKYPGDHGYPYKIQMNIGKRYDDYPVVGVSYNEVDKFIKTLNNINNKLGDSGKPYRLPTEAEWEFAARGGVKNADSLIIWAGTNKEKKLEDYAWYKKNSGNMTHQKNDTNSKHDSNDLNIYDMSGNVWEWCDGSYLKYDLKNLNSPCDTFGILRGGSFSSGADQCRVNSRNIIPKNNADDYGFRLCRSL